MSTILPRRSDSIYKEIEQFEDYEFTNCIAYEMMIRNKEVINLIYKYDDTLQEARQKRNDVVHILENEYLFPFNEDSFEADGEYYDLKFIDGLNLDIYPFIKKLKNNYAFMNVKHSYVIRSSKTSSFIFDGRKKSFSGKNTIKETNIKPCYSRPQLNAGKYSNKVSIEIDLNLPKKEILKFIEIFLEEKKYLHTPLELLGEVFEKSDNKKINKKLIADKFFIYDYVTARQEEIIKNNEFLYEEYEEVKQEIKNNPYLEKRERDIQIKELKREFEENRNSRVIEIVEGNENFAPGTAKNYYYDIKPFIDDCRYKELITGIKQ